FLLLLDEDARHRRDADAAEHEYDEARQRQVVFRARELLAEILFRVLVRTDVEDVVAERGAQAADEFVQAPFRYTKQNLPARSAAEACESRRLQIYFRDEDARAQTKTARASRLLVRHAANLKLSLADLHAVA